MLPALSPYFGQTGEAVTWATITYVFVSLTVVFWHPNPQWGLMVISRMFGWR